MHHSSALTRPQPLEGLRALLWRVGTRAQQQRPQRTPTADEPSLPQAHRPVLVRMWQCWARAEPSPGAGAAALSPALQRSRANGQPPNARALLHAHYGACVATCADSVSSCSARASSFGTAHTVSGRSCNLPCLARIASTGTQEQSRVPYRLRTSATHMRPGTVTCAQAQ